ncbi:uncharacterized protein LOC127854038 [Dreissena polymorpha]|uniref:Uncharacterized protein n=1 Tax=Dreissena polymorpha TaxID=45954 RepID=A0A9D4HLS6_DREPO|nr:uncharacterized protein LOC127854038 [Dreissena polymorpha]XP_052244917.1 uncharacterized protein LOC127854038 [Dreissena polymorpha]KAH3724134.1 hypothetical protein DPMN_049944 [Dreissena polymorpha]
MELLSTPPTALPVVREQTQFVVRTFPSDQLGLSPEFCRSSLYLAICDRNTQRTLQCIKRGSDVNVTCTKTGNTLLHVIMIEASPMTETKYVPFVYQLSNADVKFDVANLNGVTPIQLAIKLHLLELMVALIKCGATCEVESHLDLITSCSGPVEYEFRSAYRKFGPGYWEPVLEDKAFKVNVLVKSWSRINIQRGGKTLIEFAKEKGAQEKIIKQLMDNEVSIEFAHATIAGDYDRMMHLSHYTVDMETKDYSHKENYFQPYCPLTLYGAAVKYGHKHVLPLLKTGSVDVTVRRPGAQDSGEPEHSSAVCTIL